MSDGAVLAFSAGLGMMFAVGYLLSRLRDVPVEPPLDDRVKVPINRLGAVSICGGLLLSVGVVADVLALAILGAVLGTTAFIATFVAILRWRYLSEQDAPQPLSDSRE